METPRRRRIDNQTIDQVASLIARYRITEIGACHRLGIHYPSWQNFKLRANNSVVFADSLARARDARLAVLCDSIDEKGEDYLDGDRMRRGDWRAKAWLAEKITAHDRLTEAPKDSGTTVNVNVALMADTLKRLRMAQDATLLTEGNKVADDETKSPINDSRAFNGIKVPKR